LCRLINFDPRTHANNIEFTDSDSISPWAYGYVNRLVYDNMIIGYSDNTFRPKNPVTRAEAVVLVDNTRLSLMVPLYILHIKFPAHTVRARHRRKRLHLHRHRKMRMINKRVRNCQNQEYFCFLQNMFDFSRMSPRIKSFNKH